MKKYFPILLSKAGEIGALTQLSQHVKNEIVPVLQVLPETIENLKKFLTTHWNFDHNLVFLDFSLMDITENEFSLSGLYHSLQERSVNVVLVVEINSPEAYLQEVVELDCAISIRVSNEGGGFMDFNEAVNQLMSRLNKRPEEVHLLIDLGFADQNNVNMLSGLAANIFRQMHPEDRWLTIIMAAGSFPENLGGLAANQVHRLQMFEWDIWLAIHTRPEFADTIRYGDYGTKHPTYSDVEFQGSASIKYTHEKYFIIYRGQLPGDHPRGNNQYIDKARVLITTPEFYGADFSWGDMRIVEIAGRDDRPGNARSWVEISQNHHLTLLHSLL